jgi:hypothetical protein
MNIAYASILVSLYIQRLYTVYQIQYKIQLYYSICQILFTILIITLNLVGYAKPPLPTKLYLNEYRLRHWVELPKFPGKGIQSPDNSTKICRISITTRIFNKTENLL